MHVLRSLIKIIVLVLCAAVFTADAASAANRGGDGRASAAPTIYVGSHKIRAAAYIDGGRVLVPARGVFEAIDASVAYTPPHFVVVRKSGAVIAAFSLDRKYAIIGRRAVDLDAAPTRRDGRIYVPLRVVAEAVGATVAYGGRPPVIHIRPISDVGSNDIADPEAIAAARFEQDAQAQSTAQWRIGVAVFTGLCCLGCLVLTARRFGPRLFGTEPPRRSPVGPPKPPPIPSAPPPESVALTSIEATGEARVRKELVTEIRTVEVPLTREELVIEYAGEGGNVIIEGRELAAGETVRIPLWEERVQVDVTKHVLLTEDIVIGKRRTTVPAPPERPVAERVPQAPEFSGADFSVAEGSPS